MANREPDGWIQSPLHLGTTIWEDQMEDGARYAVTVTQYEWNGSRWRKSHRYRRSDLPLICKALELAHLRILKEMSPQNEADEVEDEE